MAFAFASVVATADISEGDVLCEDNIWVRRPGGGDFSAVDYDALLGRRLLRTVIRGARIRRADLDGG